VLENWLSTSSSCNAVSQTQFFFLGGLWFGWDLLENICADYISGDFITVGDLSCGYFHCATVFPSSVLGVWEREVGGGEYLLGVAMGVIA
jgi:hypothetical protein